MPASMRPAASTRDLSNSAPWKHHIWAAHIASDQDRETFVFRRFPKLSALNLLNLQEEMTELEFQIEQDLTVNPSASQAKKNASKLRRKIKEYHEALLLERNMSTLRQPGRRVLEALKQMFAQSPSEDGPLEHHYLQREIDLVALSAHTRQDYLSKYLRRAWAVPSHDAEKGNGLPTIGRFEERKIARTVTALTVVIAAIFLIGPILALYFIPLDWGKLLIIVIFTAGFATSVALITSAQRAEVFVATATPRDL
ncbi:hypothetical protein Micbo1qcDRAFT_206632 [Microdochium bolleyi]|uniref:DUF6594 domain-containing protein n=1 Tax=Microdochium bolleyi TaxID=196109 RepID=A0A136IWA0_9PEZI|nr:hypothetical protein Micbo1qcDRAFT_206632 [Microdochium bolleyi]